MSASHSSTFDRIAREFDAMIQRIALTYETNPDLAEELVQEIYVAIWRALPSFRGDASLRTFVARIATNRAVTHVARAMRVPRPVELDEGLPSPADNPEHRAIARDRTTALLLAVRQLPLTYRHTVTLVLEGLTHDEVGQVLGISANAVGIRMTRAKELLRQLLREERNDT